MSSTQLPIPAPKLAARIGGGYEDYRSIGEGHRRFIEMALPDGWSFDGKAVLDFGCGTGRTLSAFADLADRAEFVGCDIHAESIDWASKALSPPFTFFLCGESGVEPGRTVTARTRMGTIATPAVSHSATRSRT